MSAWISSHGAGAILAPDSGFSISPDEGGSVIKPTIANKLKGSVIFTLPSPPQDASHLREVKVDFSTQTARVDEVLIMSGGAQLFKKSRLRKTEPFTLVIPTAAVEGWKERKGLALSIAVEFDSIYGQIEFESVGIQVAIPVEKLKFDCGTWNITDVRPWDQPQEKTQGTIKFSDKIKFRSIPRVMVSMTGADVGGGAFVRVKVYATDVSRGGFTIHADTWSDTKLYSCGVTWIAIEQ